MNKTTVARQAKTACLLPPAQGMLQRQCACGNHTVMGGECAECAKNKSGLQRKLAIGASNDPLEREADWVAGQVLAAPAHSALGGAPPSIQRYSGQAAEGPETAPASVDRALASPGRPLEPELRQDMEQRFVHDFSRVRVHTDARAAASAQAVNALAYTVGTQIAFAEGRYAPALAGGRRLLAHELAHVIQQSQRTGAGPAPAGVQRQPDGEDPIHAPLVEDYRRRHGLPSGGIDESGSPAGPSDAQIKYQLLHAERPPPCPGVKNLEAMNMDFTDPEYRKAFIDSSCISSAAQAMPPACRFSPEQEKLLQTAQQEAAGLVQRGLDRIGTGAEGERLASDLANRLFTGEPPVVREVIDRLNGVRGFLHGNGVQFAGRTCGDKVCQRGATAYVTGPGVLPIYICPTAFSRPSEVHRTILHEALHWSGLDADPSTPEGYCEKFDCVTPCQDKDVADAWAHYLDCLGEPLEMRRSFIKKIVESVEEIP